MIYWPQICTELMEVQICHWSLMLAHQIFANVRIFGKFRPPFHAYLQIVYNSYFLWMTSDSIKILFKTCPLAIARTILIFVCVSHFRFLKPFIRRDYETVPTKMKLLQEIQAYPHRYELLCIFHGKITQCCRDSQIAGHGESRTKCPGHLMVNHLHLRQKWG